MNFENFLDKVRNKQDLTLYSHIITQIEKYEKPLGEWNEEDVDRYLTDLHSTSVNSLQRYFLLLSNLHKYHCQNNNIPYKKLKASSSISNFLDYDKSRSTIITLDDFEFIRKELDFLYDYETVNVRDKLIFELAWETLTSEEIKTLKENSVEEISEDLVILHLPHRKVNINDREIIRDIKTVKHKESTYISIQQSGRVLRYSYKDSPYLIKPVRIRSDSSRQDIANLGIVFMQIMKKLSFDITRKSRDFDGREHDLNIEKINLESIRRSKIIYMLSIKNSTIDIVRQLLDKSQQNDIAWLNKIAKKIYG